MVRGIPLTTQIPPNPKTVINYYKKDALVWYEKARKPYE
jgi:hypothetical protein